MDDFQSNFRRAALLPVWILSVVAIGCGDGRPERLLVSGQVLIDGEPLTHGFVRFVPEKGRVSSGGLDEQGRYTLGCYEVGDGVVPGGHRVEVNGGEPKGPTEILWHAPKKYSRYKMSGIEKQLAEPTDSLLIELTWDGGKPYTETLR